MTVALDQSSVRALPRASRERLVYLAAVLVFLAASVATIWSCRTMTGGMEMPGGWEMSMVWMTMPGQGWAAAAGMFLGMWMAMMVAMMLPSTLPMLVIYQRVLAFRGERRTGTFLMACGYFCVWLAFGAVAYAAGMAAAWATMRWPAVSRSVPAISGAALVLGGLFQFTSWKLACLRHCRDPLGFVAAHVGNGWMAGWKLGLHHGAFCAGCCWGLMLIQLVLGVMNLGVMALVAAVIAVEKLLPRTQMIVRLTGAAAIILGIVLATRTLL